MRRHDLAWIAGFFEGEGSIGCYRRTNTINGKQYSNWQINASIAQKDKGILLWLKRRFNTGSLYYQTSASKFGNGVWVWRLSPLNTLKFIKEIYPFMRTKRKKAQVAEAIKRRIKYAKRK